MRSKAFLRSLLVTSFMSFLAPLVMVGGGVVILALVAYLPGLTSISQILTSQILQFLATFGNGDAISGSVVIGFAFMLVGALFDIYSFYYRSLGSFGSGKGEA
ncbi:MAG: hypothetical protein NW224_07700 [Leptolyngbyaceae cyanobacterium bins.302]|nr:hypothetical protein [Leptolyngbyaceae cyanobacterium bins.302]